MRAFYVLAGILLGFFVGVAMLWSVASLTDRQRAFFATENSDLTVNPSTPKQETPTKQDILRLAFDMDVVTVQEILAAAHRQSLNGELPIDDLRDLFSAFQSTAPEVKEFAETWVDEMPDSPYALTALAWNVYTAGWNMRGNDLIQFTFYEAAYRHYNLHERARKLAQRAFQAAPDLIPASDAVIMLVLTNSSGRSNPMEKVAIVSRTLDTVMELTPNRGSILRAMNVTQPEWGGNFEGAMQLCSDYADLATDVEGYTPEICMIDAAYAYDYSDEVRSRMREALRSTDLPYLDHARRSDWEPGISRAADKKILAYLQGDGSTDLKLALSYDRNVADINGSPRASKTVADNLRLETLEKLKSDPYNPSLISNIAEPRFAIGPDQDKNDRSDEITLTKSILKVAPFDPAYWSKIARFMHTTNDASNPDENPYFANTITFSNHSPTYFFQYLEAKTQDLKAIERRADAGELPDDQMVSADEAVTCPYIRLARLREMMCSNGIEHIPSYLTSNCANMTDHAAKLAKVIVEANSRNTCAAEINGEQKELYFLEVSDTEIVLPAFIAP